MNDEYDSNVAFALEIADPFPYNVPLLGSKAGEAHIC